MCFLSLTHSVTFIHYTVSSSKIVYFEPKGKIGKIHWNRIYTSFIFFPLLVFSSVCLTCYFSPSFITLRYFFLFRFYVCYYLCVPVFFFIQHLFLFFLLFPFSPFLFLLNFGPPPSTNIYIIYKYKNQV